MRNCLSALTCSCLMTLLAPSTVMGDECQRVYTAHSREKLEEEALPLTNVSLFGLIVDPARYRSKMVSTAGMLVSGHGRTYLVPVSSRLFAFTKDAIQIENTNLPKCLLEKLDGKPVYVHGVLNGPHDDVNAIVSPVFVLGALPTE